jgi:hypothetical protein
MCGTVTALHNGRWITWGRELSPRLSIEYRIGGHEAIHFQQAYDLLTFQL